MAPASVGAFLCPRIDAGQCGGLRPDSDEHAALLAGPDGLVDSWRALGHDDASGWTCPLKDGNWRIDFAFVTPDLKDRLRRMSVDQTAQGSDHQPIRIEIEL